MSDHAATIVFAWLLAVMAVDGWYTYRWDHGLKPLWTQALTWLTLTLIPLYLMFTRPDHLDRWLAFGLFVFVMGVAYRIHSVESPGPPPEYTGGDYL